MPTDEAMLNEAMQAARDGDNTRARDLLTRLLRIDKEYPDHWLWMSAVVESRQEQIYCLQNLKRVDPGNPIARRGLVLMGVEEADLKTIRPVPPERRKGWTVAELELDRPRGWKAIMANPPLRRTVYFLAGLLTVALITAGVIGIRVRLPATPTPDFAATAAAVGKVVTLTPTLTPSLTSTPAFRTPTPTPGKPTPLVYFLDATYTPTPLYLNTPHPQAEAYRLGIRAHGRREWQAAIDFMQQTIDVDPSAVDAYYYMGDAYLQLGEYQAALDAFNIAIESDDTFGPAYLGRALVRLAIDPGADVSRDFRDAIAYASDFGLAYLARARFRIENGDFEGAGEDLIAAETLLPGTPQVPYLRALSFFRQNALEEALAMAELAHEGDFTDLPTYALLGQIEYARGNVEAAAGWLKTYVSYTTDDLEASSLLAQALARTGEFDQALQIFDRMMETEGESADLFLGRGLAYLAVGEAEAALADLNSANRLRRSDFAIMLALGRALLAAGDPGDAYVQLSETLDIAATDLEKGLVYYYRGLVLKTLVEQGDESSRPAARRDFENAVALSAILPEDIAADARLQLEGLDGTTAATPGATDTPAPTAAP